MRSNEQELQTIRRAAALMRERAEGAIKSLGSRDWTGIDTGYRRPIKEHIAGMTPSVALAVADGLDTAGADLWAHGPLCCAEGCMECDDQLWMPHVRRALATARTYLGESE